VVNALWQAGATLSSGVTPLMAAAGGEDEKAVEELLSSSDLEATDNWGKTALMYATKAQVTALEAGAAKDTTDNNGKTAMMCAQNGKE
jgi:ankyrin repeat protein